ncbi:extracellular solute-binding protein [Paenibacillus doosanensis]|uniref:ABC transporter substrate-binding protein n=1 Tax=Paenibacillus doosanensis TaxID=1229154 RepID=UPI00217F402D|nr:extracellular solute-binding protein [Paenibacillus doosanensis]MCS7461452.1 extracellular solute-binding protein [Paenibacillus doosanensis]
MKRLICLSAASALVITSVGCASSTDGSNGKTNDSKSDAVKLEFLFNRPSDVDVMKKVAEKFQTENPNITVELNAPPDMHHVVDLRLANNQPPEMFQIYPTGTTYLNVVEAGYVQDLTSDNSLFENINSGSIPINLIKDKHYDVPYGLEGWGVIYNVDIFKKFNLEVPKTYAELIQIAAKLQAEGLTPFVFSDKDFTNIRMTSTTVMAVDDPDIQNFFLDVQAGKKHVTDGQQVRKVAEKFLELRKYGQKDAFGTDGVAADREFAAGKAAMYFQNLANLKTIKAAAPDVNVSMFPFPAENANDTKMPLQVAMAISIPTNSKTAAEAKKFMTFFQKTEISQMYIEGSWLVPTIKGVANPHKELKLITDYANEGKVNRKADATWLTKDMQDDFGKALQTFLSDKNMDGFLKKADGILYGKAKQK